MPIFLKGCRRCGGDIFPERDIDDKKIHMACLQCGAVYDKVGKFSPERDPVAAGISDRPGLLTAKVKIGKRKYV